MAHPWELAWRSGRWKEVSPPLPAVMSFSNELKAENARRILDLGCGAGRHSVYLAKLGFEVTALDISESALGMLKERIDTNGISGIELVWHEMSSLPFIDGYFDGLLSSHVVHHAMLAEISKTFVEIQRVMRKDARGLIITSSSSDYRNGKGRILEPNTSVFEDGDEPDIVHHFFPREEIITLLKRSLILSVTEDSLQSNEGVRKYFNVHFRKS